MTKTVEVESSQCKQSLMEAQTRNQTLQDQLGVQRQLLRELEQQLHESQRTSSQLRQQVLNTHFLYDTRSEMVWSSEVLLSVPKRFDFVSKVER